jgi:hypothetical protein
MDSLKHMSEGYDGTTKGEIPENVKKAVAELAMDGGMTAADAQKYVTQFESGEKDIVGSNKARTFKSTDDAMYERGKQSRDEAMGALQTAIDAGLKLDATSHGSYDVDASTLAKLPAVQNAKDGAKDKMSFSSPG